MIRREMDSTKPESSTGDHAENFFKATPSASSSTLWSRLKDPRIVRVSKVFGGKDRHSKVCTVRGLRDRRVRLSVPTAIQLYDLQERLGLDQPSKVVDWLLNAAKHEIDELPPLQIPPGTFQQILASQAEKQGLKISSCSSINLRRSNYVEKSKNQVEDNWRRDEEERQLNVENQDDVYIAAGNNFPSGENLSSTSNAYNSYLRWDPSNLSLSHPPRSHGSAAADQTPEDWHGFGLAPMSGSYHHHHHHQVLVYQQPYFAPQMAATSTGYSAKPVNFQGSHSSHVGSSSALPIHFMNMISSVLPSQDCRENEHRN